MVFDRKAHNAAYCRENKEREAARHAEYYRQNKDHIAARKRVTNAELYQRNKEQVLAKQKVYRESNKERRAAYEEKNKGRRAVYQSRYRKNHKELIALYRATNKQRFAAQYQALRNQFYDGYGLKAEGHEHGVCSCPGCGADLVMFGTVSHIDGNGAQHRRAVSEIVILREAIA